MRLWSFHPGYLDRAGLVAAWREALLAQAVLAGKTEGYRHHPQLDRFRASADSLAAIGRYLSEVRAEASRRGYSFDALKIGVGGETVSPIAVTRGQVEYEWALFKKKAAARDGAAFERISSIAFPDVHPLFRLVAGGIADWERPKDLG